MPRRTSQPPAGRGEPVVSRSGPAQSPKCRSELKGRRLDTLTADSENQRVHELHRLPTFAHDDIFHVVVESPRGSTIKLKHDPSLDVFAISRPLPLGLAYPCDWGFVPSTRGPDGDPVDAAVFWDVATYPGVVIQCRAFALIKVEQSVPDGTSARQRNDRSSQFPSKAVVKRICRPRANCRLVCARSSSSSSSRRRHSKERTRGSSVGKARLQPSRCCDRPRCKNEVLVDDVIGRLRRARHDRCGRSAFGRKARRAAIRSVGVARLSQDVVRIWLVVLWHAAPVWRDISQRTRDGNLAISVLYTKSTGCRYTRRRPHMFHPVPRVDRWELLIASVVAASIALAMLAVQFL